MPTLFLDRDGVLNVRMPGDYIKSVENFLPSPGMEEAMHILASAFGRIVVVTNQAGIGKGRMSELELGVIHQKLIQTVQAAQGRIDQVYYCPHRPDEGCTCRKPATGMAWKALADFPDIDFEDAWMVGDSASDMAFGHTLGMKTVLITGKMEDIAALSVMPIHHRFDSLLEFARWYGA